MIIVRFGYIKTGFYVQIFKQVNFSLFVQNQTAACFLRPEIPVFFHAVSVEPVTEIIMNNYNLIVKGTGQGFA